MWISISNAELAVISPRSNAAELEHYQRLLSARAELDRDAMRAATKDLQLASDLIARVAIVGVKLVRHYWRPAGVLVVGALFKRARPMLRMARTGLAIWQTVQLLRSARR
jgi:hypothetical protein